MIRKIVLLLIVLGLAVGGWYFASPWLAMKGLVDAAQAGDAAEIEERVDFPALRASASDQISEATQRRRGQNGSLLDEIGGVLAESIGRQIIDRALTPDAVATLVVSGTFAIGLLPERLRGQEVTWDVEREGFNYFRAVGTFEDGTSAPLLLFAREGLGWKLTGIELR